MPRKAAKPKRKSKVASVQRRLSTIEAHLAEIAAANLSLQAEPQSVGESQRSTAETRNPPTPDRPPQTMDAPVFELREVTHYSQQRHGHFSFHDAFRGTLYDDLRFAWLCGNWSIFEKLDLKTVEHQEDRELIAALAAAAYVHLGRRADAQQAMQAALAWGLEATQAATLVMADLYRTMAKAHYFNHNHHAADEHLRCSGVAQYTPLETYLSGKKQLAESTEPGRHRRGMKMSDDLRQALPNYTVKIIFDVGSNQGQSVGAFLREYPGSQFYCFEPAHTTYQLLGATYGYFPQVKLFRKALGRHKSIAELEHGSRSTMSRITDQNPELPSHPDATRELVEIDTLDAFCAENGISHIDLLKIDTEGGDLEVLQGASKLLAEHAVDLISVEAAMSRLNRRHCQLASLQHHLEDRGYYLFGVYEQKSEWVSRQPHLRRANALFISGALIEASTGRAAASIPDREKSP
jgi:FkbM family methyltransferase